MPNTKTDAVLNQDPGPGEFLYDFKYDAMGDIESADQLDTAIIVSLWSDRRAAKGEIVKPQQRRGWVGDLENPDDPIGSKLWLYEQSRLTRTVITGISQAAKRALEWMVRDKIALGVDARANVRATRLELTVDITKPNSVAESRNFSLWENTGKR